MGRQFLETLWPMLCFARLLGMFPFRRVWTDDGKMELNPINWKFQGTLFACLYTLILILKMASYAWIFIKAEITIEGVTQCQHSLNGGESSTIDYLTTSIPWFVLYIGVIVIQFGNFKMRQGLCEISSIVDRASQEDSLVIPFLTVCGLLVATIVTSSWFNGSLIQSCLKVNWVDVAPLFVSFGLLFAFVCIPMLVFFTLALECFSALSYKSTKLKLQIELHKRLCTAQHSGVPCRAMTQTKQYHNTLQDCLSMITLLEKVKSQLSRNIRVVMVILSVLNLTWLYMIPLSFIYYSRKKEPLVLVLAVVASLHVITYFTMIWLLNIRAQKVTDQVHQLKNCLQEIFISQNTMVTFEDQTVPASFIKDRIVDKMNRFNGFDGNGYFVLGKSFVLNLKAVLATYFVILLQFKMSE